MKNLFFLRKKEFSVEEAENQKKIAELKKNRKHLYDELSNHCYMHDSSAWLVTASMLFGYVAISAAADNSSAYHREHRLRICNQIDQIDDQIRSLRCPNSNSRSNTFRRL